MAALTSISLTAIGIGIGQRKGWVRSCGGNGNVSIIRWRMNPGADQLLAIGINSPVLYSSPTCIRCISVSADVPTVAETKLAFLKAYKRPVPSIYNNVLLELMVQQHLLRYRRTYQYDAVFALGFVTVYDQLMDGYPSDEDRDAIFRAYIHALKEDPEQYRSDAKKLEEWASSQDAKSIVEFQLRDGEVEKILKDIAERAAEKKNFNYSRFFAIGLFRLLERANATDPIILEKLCEALNISKRSVDRDLDVYRNLLSKLVQSKELLKEYIEREKKKRAEREANQRPDKAVTKMEGINL